MLTRHMEVFAAMLDSVDQNVGRLTAFLEQIGELDNTIILFSSDNGGTDAGGPTGMFNNSRRYMGLAAPPPEVERANAPDLGTPRSAPLYPTGWGEVSNTPFPSFKTYTGAGGRRVSFIVSWPKRIREGGAIRTQFAHVTDVMPTLLDLAGVPALKSVNGMAARAGAMAALRTARQLSLHGRDPRRDRHPWRPCCLTYPALIAALSRIGWRIGIRTNAKSGLFNRLGRFRTSFMSGKSK